MSFTESWLNPSVKDTDISIPSYKFFRKDRTNCVGGGVEVYTKENINCVHTPDLQIVISRISMILMSNFDPNLEKFTSELTTIEITEKDVEDILLNLDTSKAIGPDCVSPRLLK
ncbi:Hypothetical predicted protein [Mytilus galloprovincialis]|uniref:Uncharacterized protein n=1 Tax=Mytilus galloprovincialis TaxID=29158 RepID=A0A8B6GPJ2_MYTGA|nr:Hypothetical predicted protein [Mytilus galloprovincialis]